MEFFPERTPEESMTQGKANTYGQLFSEHGNQLEVVASFTKAAPSPEFGAVMRKEASGRLSLFPKIHPFY